MGAFGEKPGFDPSTRKQTAQDISEHNKQASGYMQGASDNAKGLEKQQRETKKTDLNKYQNSNYATDGGQFGRANNKDYSTTLRLARQADAYNAKPTPHMYSARWGQGMQDVGTGFDRPNVETQETRAMNQTWQLDTNQKQLAQALQDAVNHKDLDAFKATYAQLYGINLSDYQARMSMSQLAHSGYIQQHLAKDLADWQNRFQNFSTAERAGAYADLVSNGQGMLAGLIGGNLLPYFSPVTQGDFSTDRLAAQKKAQYMSYPWNLSEYEAEERARRDVQAIAAAEQKKADAQNKKIK